MNYIVYQRLKLELLKSQIEIDNKKTIFLNLIKNISNKQTAISCC